MRQSLIVQSGRWKPGKRRLLPAHRNAGLEIVYIPAGQSLWQIEGRTHRIWPGSVFFTLPWQEHGGVQPMQPGLELWYVVIALKQAYDRPRRSIQLHPSLPVSARWARRLSQALVSSERHALPATPAMRWAMPQLVNACARQPAEHESITPLVQLTLVELLRALEMPYADGAQPLPAEQRVHWCLTQMASQCEQRWSLERMARACGLSRTRTGDLIRQITGDTPVMALNRLRVDRAQKLLRETDLPITEVAMDCGFESSQYFARTFKAYTGLRPRDYRARHRTSAGA